MTLKLSAPLALFAAVFIAGCQDPVMAPQAGQPDLLPLQAYPTIAVTSGPHKWLAFGPPNIQAGPEQPMSIVTPVRVLDEGAINTQYRYLFFDQTGRPIKPEMEWRYKRLPARVQAFLEGAALDTNAFDWRLEVRTAR